MNATMLLPAATLAAILLPAAVEGAPAYTLHEWGTFTTVIGSDGTHLDGVHREDAPLPGFVYELDAPPKQDPQVRQMTKGLDYSRSFAHVNVRLETPVIYFYTDEAFDARVEVGFENGTIGQWYPDRSGGEARHPERLLDFAAPRVGSIRWDVKVEPAGEDASARVFRAGELPCWIYPRYPDSALVTNTAGETEKYLFYRGLGRMELPVTFTASDDELHAANRGPDQIARWLVFDNDGRGGARWWTPQPLGAAGGSVSVPLEETGYQTNWRAALYADGVAMLVAAGLFRKEADAMMQTWWASYFETPGLRVFWIVPRAKVDEVLPLSVSLQPQELERVIVGRSEILRPDFERGLLSDFAAAMGQEGRNRWASDRFFPAYAARVAQLEAAGPAEAAALPLGHWRVSFANGIVATCEIRADGGVTVTQPGRRSSGRAQVVDGKCVEIRFADDRAERWTVRGDTLAVEHWHPIAAMPDQAPVRGTAERIEQVLEVHEWGTFTVLQGSDGEVIRWYQAPDKLVGLPPFVRRTPSPAGKSGTASAWFSSGMDTVRMETPVLYFYPEREMEISVSAKFPSGRITEFFPPAHSTTLDETVWRGQLLPPDSPARDEVPVADGAEGRHYAAARAVPDAWLFRAHDPRLATLPPGTPAAVLEAIEKSLAAQRVQDQQPELVDHFIFYRGAGGDRSFALGCEQQGGPGTFSLTNRGEAPIPTVLALRVSGGQSSWTRIDSLLPVAHQDGKILNRETFTFPEPAGPAPEVAEGLRHLMVASLQAEGLTLAEAEAMVATWDDLWFTEPGTRLLAILPQSSADAMVPLQITPPPTRLERVFVARVELITREQEQILTDLLDAGQPGGEQDLADAAAKFSELQLGRYAAGGLERAASLVSKQMRERFAALSRASVEAQGDLGRVTAAANP